MSALLLQEIRDARPLALGLPLPEDPRLARAVDLMARGRPLAEVAEEVGYAAPAAFSTMFKRALGVAPSRFALPRDSQ